MDLQLAVQIQQWQRPLDSCATCPEAHQKCLNAKQPASLRAALPSLSWHYNMMEQVRTSNFMAVLPLIQVVLVFIPKLSTATWESNIRRSHTAGQGAQSIWGEWCTKYAKDRSRPWHHLQDGTIFSKHPCFSTRSMILCCAYLVPMLIMRRGNSYSTWCYSKLICFGFARVVDVF